MNTGSKNIKKFVGWVIRIFISGAATLFLITPVFGILSSDGKSALILLISLLWFTFSGFVLFPIYLVRFANSIHSLMFNFEDKICRSDGDFFDFYDFDIIAFSGAVYALFGLCAFFLKAKFQRDTNPVLVWLLALCASSATILLSQQLLPTSMADCFK